MTAKHKHSKPPASRRIYHWVNDRFPLTRFVNWSMTESIVGGTRFAYTLGSASLFLFLIQVVTGLWQMFYYVPTIDHAYDSLNYLRFQVSFGWLVHGLHYWGAQAFTVVVGLHVIRVFIWGAYKKPREMVWILGVFLLIMTAAFMFTGPILPWDKKGYWAGQVGLNMAGSVPIVGPFMQSLLQGANKLGQLALTRMYVLHVAIIPFIAVFFIIAHLIAFRKFGSVGPWDEKKRQAPVGWFWAEQLFKDAVVALALFILLVGLSVYFPAPISGLADPMDTFYTPKPEWNFLFLYQMLKYLSGPFEVLGIVGLPLIIVLTFLSLPFLDRSPERNPFKRMFVLSCGLFFVVFVVAMTWIGYKSNSPEVEKAQIENSASVPSVDAGVTPTGNMPGTEPSANIPAAHSRTKQSDGPIVGEKLFKSLGCNSCHTLTGEISNKPGPDLLMMITPSMTREWLRVQLVDPQKHNPNTLMPPYGNLDDRKINALIDFLQQLPSRKAKMPKRVQQVQKQNASNPVGDPKLGEQIFTTVGCLQCHSITGSASGKLGPDLVQVQTNRRSAQWLHDQLMSPQTHNPSSIMPSYAQLGDDKLNGLIAYIKNLPPQNTKESSTGNSLNPTEGKSQATSQTSGQEEAQQQHQKPSDQNENGSTVGGATSQDQGNGDTSNSESGAGPDNTVKNIEPAIEIIGDQEHGHILFRQYCVMCHGPQGNVKTPNFFAPKGVPSLHPIREGLFSKRQEEFIRKIDPFIQHGFPNPSGGPNMPAFGDTHALTQAQIADIEAFVLQLNGVNRAEIQNPGVEPQEFFFIIIEIAGVVAVLFLILWAVRRYVK